MPLPASALDAMQIVSDDVTAAFGAAFPGAFSIPPPFEEDLRVASDTTVAVPWRWDGTHTGAFLDRAATGLAVQITGVTLLRLDEHGDLAFHRIVDWLHLYRCIGAVVANRTPLDRSTLLDAADES